MRTLIVLWPVFITNIFTTQAVLLILDKVDFLGAGNTVKNIIQNAISTASYTITFGNKESEKKIKKILVDILNYVASIKKSPKKNKS